MNDSGEKGGFDKEAQGRLGDETVGNNDRGSGVPKLIVVGVGASAGGLEAMQAFVSNLPTDINMSFVIAQHLSPSYKSMMVDLLEKDSTIPICAAEDGEQLRANRIYICPPNYNIELMPGDVLKLSNFAEVLHTPRPSVDMLFESLAIVKGDQAIGIVLSGTGSDGARGIRAIKGESGFGIVQDPNTAKYNGMPNAAINSGNVDLILSPTEMGEELKNLLVFPSISRQGDSPLVPIDVYRSIMKLIKAHCKVDFTLYKESTIERRIERRMVSLKIPEPQDYLDYLKNNNSEVTFLFNDMLIGVTSFFRDARAFDILRTELTHYINRKEDNVIRIWSVGCSTGEEPYSIAMMLSEILGKRLQDFKIQIFATDIDQRALNYARNAVYPEAALQNVPKSIKNKFFMVANDQFEVIKPIKAMVIFSIQDINRDPPFLRLDLISCRNLMIYFTLELQRQILPVFHYALNPKGLLMLGQSESIGVFQEQYRPLSKSAKIYEAVFVGKKLPPERNVARRTIADYKDPSLSAEKSVVKTGLAGLDDQLSGLITKRIREVVLPNATLINENLDIVYTQGANPLLVRPEGISTNNIFKNLNPMFSIDLRAALHGLEKGAEVAETGYQMVDVGGESVWIKLMVTAVVREGPRSSLILIFGVIEQNENLPVRNSEVLEEGEGERFVRLEQERLLAKTKEQLQDVIEELETSNEEMQSMNEELQSSNEELQSSNEELETTNEELQSTNEELQSAYAEVRLAYDEKDEHQNELVKLRTELEQANSLLEEAEKIGRTGSWMWDVPTRKFTWSNGCYTIYGLNKNAFQPSFQAFIGLAHPDDRNRLEEHMRDLIVGKAVQPFVFKASTSNNALRYISLEAVVSFNDLKQAVKVMGTMKDITEKAFYENSESSHRDKIGYILKSSLSGAFLYNFNSRNLDYINPCFTEMLGYTLDEVKDISEGFKELLHPDDLDVVNTVFERVRYGKIGATYPSAYRLKVSGESDFIHVYANHTLYDIDADMGRAKQMLVTFFASEDR